MPLGLSTFRIITYAFLFLARLRFPAQDSIIKILRRRYGDGLIKKVWKFEKFHSSSLSMVFDSISSNIDEVLSINPSANVFVFGDFNVHHKDCLTYSGGTDWPGELSYNFFISNDLTQMVNFPTQIPDLQITDSRLILIVLLFWIYFFPLTLAIVPQWLSLHWEILVILLSQFPLTFHQIHKRMPHFIT